MTNGLTSGIAVSASRRRRSAAAGAGSRACHSDASKGLRHSMSGHLRVSEQACDAGAET